LGAIIYEKRGKEVTAELLSRVLNVVRTGANPLYSISG
jgi:hypothetical protein